MSGAWVFVCGPSGAGKDSVIAWAKKTLLAHPNIVFARRSVTRAMQAGSDHDPLTESDFHAMVHTDSLCWHWQAHGFFYGIAQHYAAEVKAGRIVVVNGSRDHVNTLSPSTDVRVVQVSADPEQLAARLVKRGRDAASAVAERLARNTRFVGMKADFMIVNDAEVDVAGQQLADYLST
jgi:ribose 1,5-bisphosphokinase